MEKAPQRWIPDLQRPGGEYSNYVARIILSTAGYTTQLLKEQFFGICIKNKIENPEELWTEFCVRNGIKDKTVSLGSDNSKLPTWPNDLPDFYK